MTIYINSRNLILKSKYIYIFIKNYSLFCIKRNIHTIFLKLFYLSVWNTVQFFFKNYKIGLIFFLNYRFGNVVINPKPISK